MDQVIKTVSKSGSPQPETTGKFSTQPGVNSNPISRKLNKILEGRIENDKDLLEALKTLSGFFPENSIRSRRNLRSEIEKRSLILNEEFLNTFGSIKEVSRVFWQRYLNPELFRSKRKKSYLI